MSPQDRNAVLQAWNGMLSVYGRAPMSDPVAIGMFLSVFEGYTARDVICGITDYMKSNNTYAAVPAQVLEMIKNRRGEGEEELAKKAERAYQQLTLNANNANDWIVSDRRASVAIKAVFGSPQQFARTNYDEYTQERKHVAFIEAYKRATQKEIQEAQRLYGGFYARSDNPIVSFLGDYEECKRIALEEYEGRHPRLPAPPITDPKAMLPRKVVRPKLSLAERMEERKVSQAYLRKAMEILNKCIVR